MEELIDILLHFAYHMHSLVHVASYKRNSLPFIQNQLLKDVNNEIRVAILCLACPWKSDGFVRGKVSYHYIACQQMKFHINKNVPLTLKEYQSTSVQLIR